MQTPNSFLGRGWSFPPAFDIDSREVEMVSDEVDISQSLDILLSTSLGERIMQPDYGCDLNDLLFEPMNTSFQTYITDMVRSAILYYESRITVEDIVLSADGELEGTIMINIVYMVTATNSRYNYVYPYYLKEGSSLPYSGKIDG